MITIPAARPSLLPKAISFLLLPLIFVLQSGLAYPQGFELDRWNRGFYFAASVRNAVILVRSSRTENMQLLLVDFETGKLTKLVSPSSHFLSPFLSPDGARLLFSRQPLDRRGHELVSCTTGNLICHVVLRSEGSIHSAIEISGDRILYVSSPYTTGGDGRVRLSRNDIWVFDPRTGPRRLSDLRLYQLHSLSVAQNQIYFSAYGSSPDKQLVSTPNPNANQQSDIFRLPFDSEKATIDPPSGTMTPLFASSGIASHPTASADGSMVAFLRSRTGISPYHYNLVIAGLNGESERLVESPGLGSSRPVIIDHDVYVSVTGENRVLVQVNRQGEGSMKPLADIDNASISGAETVELKIEP